MLTSVLVNYIYTENKSHFILECPIQPYCTSPPDGYYTNMFRRIIVGCVIWVEGLGGGGEWRVERLVDGGTSPLSNHYCRSEARIPH